MHDENRNIPVLLSKYDLWNGVKVEEYWFPPMQLHMPKVVGHRLVINIGRPLNVSWKTKDRWNTKEYNTGDIAIVPDGGINEPRWDKELNVIIITLNPDFTQQLVDLNDLSLKEVRGIKDDLLFHFSLSFKEELYYENFASKIYGESLAVALAIHIATKYSLTDKNIFAPKGKLSSVQLKQIIEYANSCIDKNIGLDDLSQYIHLSPFHFTRLFKETTGLTPHQYILKLKTDRAIQLMIQNKSTLTEIAYMLGFTDQAHFSNTFRKTTGFSPRQFLNKKVSKNLQVSAHGLL